MFEKIKKFYDMHLYTVKEVQVYLDKGVITLQEFKMIVGDE